MRGFLPRIAGAVLILLAMTVASAEEQKVAERTDPGWPRVVEENGIQVAFYQPQVDKWADEVLEARQAVAVTPAGATEPLYGALWIKAQTATDLDARMVTLADIQVTQAQFPGAGENEKGLVEMVSAMLPRGPRTIALDRLLENLARSQQEQRVRTAPIKSDPPKILFAQGPAILVLIDGQPILKPIEGTGLMHVMNSYWDILLDTASARYYLLAGDQWLTAPDLMNGPWTVAAALPAGVARIPEGHPRARAREAALKPAVAGQPAPAVFLRTEPAELVVLDGEPNFSHIQGTQLLYITNTESDVFLHMGTQDYYVLLSGRWFRARSIAGPWQAVEPTALPADFAAIPPEHPRGRVLASVPSTPQAQQAVIASQIPRLATVKRADATVAVAYDGAPNFAPIAGTPIYYAANTNYDVLRYGGGYYCCYSGVWFSAGVPLGPWVVCDAVPAVFYTIPPSCPLYRVTYVRMHRHTPDAVVFGYTAGYLGSYVYDGVVVYGTGYYYPPYCGAVYYYGQPWTFGFSARYHHFSGGFVYGGRAFDRYPYVAVRAGYYPWNGWYRGGYHRQDAYAGWGSAVVIRGDFRDREDHGRREQPRTVIAPPTPPAKVIGPRVPQPHISGPKASDDVYVGKDGNVYKRAESGWQRYERGKWSRVDAPKAPATVDVRTPISPREPRVVTPSERVIERPRVYMPPNPVPSVPERPVAPATVTPKLPRQPSTPGEGVILPRTSREESPRAPSNLDLLERDAASRRAGDQRSSEFRSWRQDNDQPSSGGSRSGDSRPGEGPRPRRR